VSWDFAVTQPGTFAVEVLQGCGKGSGGSEDQQGAGNGGGNDGLAHLMLLYE